tara:strand:- start:37018 stop:37899 length:882 start_codon:yes stop_codon:yes gene_type:complete
MTNVNHTISAPKSLDTLRTWEPVAKETWYRDQNGTLRNTENVSKVVFRNDTGAAVGSIGASAGIVSNAAKIELFESLETRGVLSNLKCGEFRGGARVWLRGTSKANSFELKPGHEIAHNLMLVDGYDGGISMLLADTAINYACENMFSTLHKAKSTQKIRHTVNVEARFAALVQQIHASVTGFEKTKAALQHLTTQRANFGDLRAMLDEFFPMPAADADSNGRKATNTQTTRNRVAWAYENAPGADAGTRYGLYQAATYWLTHERGRDGSRFEQNITGEGARLNRAFLAHALN